ncbi:hypothetical protein AM1_B0128 (plasmid) [Acaryochloris marina MBIC11017]|uniref:Uncharacterized protein n=2 Tax=Acaryochloris marina TaxID=155978 RepID=A8ZM84_ACAM1|nr:hypothetical protein AM1_B0128 [Acaryochloris marina MBIC11017]
MLAVVDGRTVKLYRDTRGISSSHADIHQSVSPGWVSELCDDDTVLGGWIATV